MRYHSGLFYISDKDADDGDHSYMDGSGWGKDTVLACGTLAAQNVADAAEREMEGTLPSL